MSMAVALANACVEAHGVFNVAFHDGAAWFREKDINSIPSSASLSYSNCVSSLVSPNRPCQ